MPELGPAVEYEARSRLGLAEADAFLARLETLSFDITGPLGRLYGGVADVHKLATRLVLDALHAAAARPADLRRLDRRREIDPAWFQRSRMIGYVCYADRFAGSLPQIRQHLDYLVELGVTYYAGRFPGSFGRGALFQDNPVTGDARISGAPAQRAVPLADQLRRRPQSADAGIIARAGLYAPVYVHSSTGQLDIRGDRIELPPGASPGSPARDGLNG